MPYLRGVLNALVSRRPAADARLDPAAFLRHAEALARPLAVPPGLWVSFIGEAAPRGSPAAGPAEYVDALERARAPFVARLGPAGRLTRYAAGRIAAALAAHPEAEGLYTDEVFLDARGRAREIVLKPAFDPVLLEGFDYFGRLAVYRRERVAALGGWSEGGEHGLALRVAAATGAIWHLPYPAYVGPARAWPAAAAGAPAQGPWPKVSVVIPNLDAPGLIGAVLAGLFERTDYPDFDVTVVDNGSTDPATLGVYARYAGARFRVEVKPAPFNFSRAVNRGAELSDGALLLLLNNDIEVIEPGWLKQMAACLRYPGAGIVGAKLIYPDRTLQHVGVIAGLGGYAGHWHIGRAEGEPGPQGRLGFAQSLSVVTGACMLVARGCFEAVGGFDEQTFPVAYNDVDFCLRAGSQGFRVVWTPLAKLIHHESASRGSDETALNLARFAADKAALRARHRTDSLEDRAYNPWASRRASDPWPAARSALPAARR